MVLDLFLVLKALLSAGKTLPVLFVFLAWNYSQISITLITVTALNVNDSLKGLENLLQSAQQGTFSFNICKVGS